MILFDCNLIRRWKCGLASSFVGHSRLKVEAVSLKKQFISPSVPAFWTLDVHIHGRGLAGFVFLYNELVES